MATATPPAQAQMPHQSQEPQFQYAPKANPVYYVQQPQQPQQRAPVNKAWHITKIVLGAFSMLFAIIAIGVTAGRLRSRLPRYVRVLTVCVAPPASVAIVWALAEFITIGARRGKRGIHPGAHVGVHLVLWLGFAVALAFVILFAIEDTYDFRASYYGYDYSRYESGHNTYNAAIAMTALLLIIHFALFVGACVETAKRNASRPVFFISPDAAYPQPQMVLYPQNPPQASYPVPLQAHTPVSSTQ